MIFKKKGFPRLKTEKGGVEWTAGLFFLLFLGILMCAALQVRVFASVSDELEDTLALSNLASAVIDVEEYGISHRLVISDPRRSYELFCRAVQENLNLDGEWQPKADGLIRGPVKMEQYIVYSVSGNDVTVSSFDENGGMRQQIRPLGATVAPNGLPVEYTGIYSEISCWTEGLWGIAVQARKGKLVDIAPNEP